MIGKLDKKLAKKLGFGRKRNVLYMKCTLAEMVISIELSHKLSAAVNRPNLWNYIISLKTI